LSSADTSQSIQSQGQLHARRHWFARALGCVALPLVPVALLSVAACTTVNTQPAPALGKELAWALLPLLNNTETPQAGLRGEAILESLLRTGGYRQLTRYPAGLNKESLFDPASRKAVDEALIWAKAQGIRFAITGTVDEWRYKVGVDGEPAVGMTLQIIDVRDDTVIWSAAGSKTGWSRESVAAVAQKLIAQLTRPLV
jgi:polysaccharide biosynthesis protein PelC